MFQPEMAGKGRGFLCYKLPVAQRYRFLTQLGVCVCGLKLIRSIHDNVREPLGLGFDEAW